MTAYYVKSGAGAAEFNAAHAYSVGDKIVPTRADVSSNVNLARGWVWECTTGGTTNGAASWGAAVTQDVTTMTQNGVVFTARRPGYSSGTTANWAFATIYLDYLCRATSTAIVADGDIVYISNNHAENISGNLNLQWPSAAANLFVYCVDDAAAPPTALATTATCTCSSAVTALSVATLTNIYFYGIAFIAGTSVAIAGSAGGRYTVERCSLQPTTSINLGSSTPADVWLINTDVKFGSSATAILCTIQGAFTRWSGGSILSGGGTPTDIFGIDRGSLLVEDVDFSNAPSGVNLEHASAVNQTITFRNCKMPSGWSGGVFSGSIASGSRAKMTASDISSSLLLREAMNAGDIYHETTLVQSGGASDGTTPLSWKLVSSSTCSKANPLITSEILVRNIATVSKAVTIEILHDSATALKEDEVWIEAQYFSASGNPLGARVVDQVVLNPSNQSSSAVTWTTTGMSNPNKQKLDVTFTPGQAGYFLLRVFLAKPSYTIYASPKPS